MSNKVILIIGATSMIGRACAQLFVKNGMKVMLVARDQSKLKLLAQELDGDVEICAADVTQPEQIKYAITQTTEIFQRIDSVIYNTAVYPWKQIEQLDLAEWNQTLNTNLTAAFLTIQYCFHIMKNQQAGNIIFISSIAGEVIGLPYMAAYASTKAGLNGLMRTAALEFAPYNIKVNSISPGKVYDPSALSEKEYQNKIATVPLQRFIEPEDIASMALFLLSNQAKNITGQNFIIDGGQSILSN